jgi:hypothetical protein
MHRSYRDVQMRYLKTVRASPEIARVGGLFVIYAALQFAHGTSLRGPTAGKLVMSALSWDAYTSLL